VFQLNLKVLHHAVEDPFPVIPGTGAEKMAQGREAFPYLIEVSLRQLTSKCEATALDLPGAIVKSELKSTGQVVVQLGKIRRQALDPAQRCGIRREALRNRLKQATLLRMCGLT